MARFYLALALFLAGCTASQGAMPVRPLRLPAATPLSAPAAVKPPTLAPRVVFPTPTPTPDPYAGLTIDDLAERAYGEGEFQSLDVLQVTAAFTRTLVSYESDGLTVFGFMNVPAGQGPFPVVLVNHGYVEPSVYRTLTYTTRYADALARAGFLVIHPNYRGYGLSEDGPNEFRVGFTTDVLNLAGLVRRLGGQPGPLAQADPDHIGLWGHSMGGGITLKAATAQPNLVDAAVLYGAMSGDEARNHDRIFNYFTNGVRGLYDPDHPPSATELQRLSPIYHLNRLAAPISVHHGELDGEVPPWWSEDLCDRLRELGKAVECFTYAGQPHTFTGEGDALFMERVVEFFQRHLQPEAPS